MASSADGMILDNDDSRDGETVALLSQMHAVEGAWVRATLFRREDCAAAAVAAEFSPPRMGVDDCC